MNFSSVRFILSLAFAGYSLMGIAQPPQKTPQKKKEEHEATPIDESTYFKIFSGNAPAQNNTKLGTAPKFPQRKAGLLASLPNLSSEQQVASYIQRLHSLFSSKAPASKMADVKKVITSTGDDAEKLNNAAVVGWQSGASYEAVLLALEACRKNPKDHLALNNLSALLNLAGGEIKSIPLLRKLVIDHPESSLILNNLGQAYTGVGELDSAMVYLKRCIEKAPDHPEANNTAGEIEQSRGNTEKAQQYFEQSIQSVITPASLKRIENNYTADWIRPRPKVNLPYFNPYAGKYEMRKQIESVEEALTLGAEHEAYESFLSSTKDLYTDLVNAETDKHQALENQYGNRGAAGISIPPYAPIASRIASALNISYQYREQSLYKYIQDKEQEIEKLRKEYADKRLQIIESCGPAGKACYCPRLNAAATDFLKAVAPIRRDIQRKQLVLARERFENMAYYGYLSGVNTHDARRNFYEACGKYLQDLMEANKTESEGPCDNFDQVQADEIPLDEPVKPFCPINLKVDIKVGSLEVSCDKFKISAFGGVLKGSKNADTKQYTLALGVELKHEFEYGAKVGIKEKIGMEQNLFVVFDENNNFVDAGVAWGAKGGIEKASNISKGKLDDEIGKNVGGVDRISKIEASANWSVGINSGWTFDKGAEKIFNPISEVIIAALPPGK